MLHLALVSVMRCLIVILAGGLACSSGASKRSEAPIDAAAPDAVPVVGDPGEPGSAGDPGATSEPRQPPGPPFPAHVRSLALKRSIAVRMRPARDAERYGTIAANTRVAWKQVAVNDDCSSRWVEIEPHGWICESYLRPSEEWPHGVELPRLAREEIVPGVYGKVVGEPAIVYHHEGPAEAGAEPAVKKGVKTIGKPGGKPAEKPAEKPSGKGEPESRLPTKAEPGSASSDASPSGTGEGVEQAPADPADAAATEEEDDHEREEMAIARTIEKSNSVMVRQYGELTVGEARYWRINNRGKREYLPAEAVREYRPSQLSGLRLGDDTGRTLPVGFPMSRERMSARIPVYSAARGGRRVARVPGRQPWAVLETARDDGGRALAYRIGDERWVRASQMRLAERTTPPPTTQAGERWIDIDLDRQILVAYEGELPVYTTLVATGTRKHATETGIFRIWVKFAEKNMSDLAGEDPYSVATVPWAQFYDKDFALHTSYWHDRFGVRRSHGCTNLAPRDARFLYFWSEPAVPPGWSMAKGTLEHPGTLIRIRSAEQPEPGFRGYAAEIWRARGGASPAPTVPDPASRTEGAAVPTASRPRAECHDEDPARCAPGAANPPGAGNPPGAMDGPIVPVNRP